MSPAGCTTFPASVITAFRPYLPALFMKRQSGRPGLMNSSSTPFVSVQSATTVNSGPLSNRNLRGSRCHSAIRSSALVTLCEGRLVSTSIASASRLKSSTTLNVRNLRPSHNASLMKPADQHRLAASGTKIGSGFLAGSRRLLRRRLFSFIEQ